MASLTERMMRAARLDAALYEEVEADTTATSQAMGVVVLSAVASGIGGMSHAGVGGLIALTLSNLFAWYVQAFVIYYIGTKWLPEPTTQADTGQLLRTLGFASSPGIIRIAGIIPGLGLVALFVAPLWMLCATVVAVRQALDYSSTGRAIAVCMIGWLVQFAIIIAVGVALGMIAGAESSYLPEA
jgi:hypothetical protein